MSENNTPEMMEEESEIMLLTDEEGNEVPFELLDVIDYNGEQFAVFFPVEEQDENEDDGEVVILKVTPHDDGTADMESIDDEAKLDAVFEIFMEHVREEFEAEDCEDDDEHEHHCGCGCCHD